MQGYRNDDWNWHPTFEKLDANLAKAIMSIGQSKALRLETGLKRLKLQESIIMMNS